MRTFKLFYTLLAITLIHSGCDKVENPYPPVSNGPSESCDTIFSFSQTQTVRAVLIEEFTGHYCSNCPQAAWYLQQLKSTYGDQVITVAIHPSIGTLTDPQSNPDGSYSTDWRTEEGELLYNYFGMPLVPVGMLNRSDLGTGNYYHWHTTWQSKVPTIVGQAADISIRNSGDFLSTEDIVCGKIEVEILNNISGDLYLTTYLVEDSIQDWQKIAAGAEASGSVHPHYPAGDISTYYHRHVVRDVHGHVGIREGDNSGNGSISGTFLGNQAFLAGEKFQFLISFDNLDASWDSDHLYLVTFVHDNTTKEVLQVSEIHVTP